MSGRYWDDPATIERRLYRGLVVARYTDTTAIEYIRAAKGC